MAEGALYDLLSWMSPAWPIGAFAHSGGLEWAVEAGRVSDRVSTERWIGDLIAHGPVQTDLVLFVHAFRAATAGEGARLGEVAELAVAAQTGFERRLETTAQGAAFRRIAAATVPPLPVGEGLYTALLAPIDDDDLAYPVAVACLMATQGVPLLSALTAYLHGVAANLVSAAQRLVPLGQTDGQLVLRALREPVFASAAWAEGLPEGDPFDQMGSASMLADIACMAHETQYTRLFRT